MLHRQPLSKFPGLTCVLAEQTEESQYPLGDSRVHRIANVNEPAKTISNEFFSNLLVDSHPQKDVESEREDSSAEQYADWERQYPGEQQISQRFGL
jgi:hypothetical protein